MSSIINATALQICLTQNQLVPQEGPKALPIPLDFTNDASNLLDLTMIQQRVAISLIQAVYVDNGDNPNQLQIDINTSGQRLLIKANTCGYYPVMCTNPVKMVFTSVKGATARVFLLNSPISGYNWDTI